MKYTDIKRVPVVPSDELLLNTQLYTKAKALLNYEASRIPVYGQLTHALKELGIEPLNRRQVEEYKSKKTYRTMTNVQRVAIALLTYTALAMITCTFLSNTYLSANTQETWLWLTGIITSGALWIVFTIWQDGAERKRIIVSWHRNTIGGFAGYIPEHILSKACEIREKVPGVSLLVDQQYTDNERWRKPAPDPFLVAQLGNEEFYIDVWDEPEFEKRATMRMHK